MPPLSLLSRPWTGTT